MHEQPDFVGEAHARMQTTARGEVDRPKYMSISDWTHFAGMGTTSIYAALASGDLKAIKVGRKTLIDVEHGLAWLSERPAWTPTGPVSRRRVAATTRATSCNRRGAVRGARS
jgi:hypothetical protein